MLHQGIMRYNNDAKVNQFLLMQRELLQSWPWAMKDAIDYLSAGDNL